MEVEFARDAAGLLVESGKLNGKGAGDRTATPSVPPALVPTRASTGVWSALLLRVAGAALLLIGLAGIGIAATRAEHSGRLATSLAALATSASNAPSVAGSAESDAPSVAGSAESAEPVAEPVKPDGCNESAGECQPAQPTTGVTADGKVILNLASAAELQRLPGVGAVRAAAILTLRTRLKKFRRASELLQVKGIGPRSLQRLLPHMVVDAPPPSVDPKAPPAGPPISDQRPK